MCASWQHDMHRLQLYENGLVRVSLLDSLIAYPGSSALIISVSRVRWRARSTRGGQTGSALPLAWYIFLPFAFAYDATALERARPGLQHMSVAAGGVTCFQLQAHLPFAAAIDLLAPG